MAKEEKTEEQVDMNPEPVTPDGFNEVVEEIAKEVVSEDTSDAEEEVSEETEDEEVVEEEAETEVEAEEEEAEEETSEEVKVEKTKVEEKPQEDVAEEKFEELKFDLNTDLVDPQVKAALDAAAAAINAQRKSINKQTKDLKAERDKAFENRIDKCFDSLTEDLEVLGSSSSLTEQNGKLRRKLFGIAHVTAQTDGITIEDAIKDTVSMWKNRDGEKTAEKKLITKLSKQKKKFTNTPTRKKSNIESRKFKSETEKANAVMDQAYKDAGIE